jgi:hypothetical protein
MTELAECLETLVKTNKKIEVKKENILLFNVLTIALEEANVLVA